MSIMRLKNTNGGDSEPQEWANNKVFPNNIYVDLMNEKDGVGLLIDDIIGIENGAVYENIKDLIINSGWKLGDGHRDYYYYEALHLLTNGNTTGFKLEGESKTIVSHDLCEKTTWYQKAIQINDDIATKVDDNIYKTTHDNLICLRRGFMYQEDNIPFQENFNIKVNDVIITDISKYSITPVTGVIVFVDGFLENLDVVKCSYKYAKSSTFEIQTDDLHLWRIIKTEIQLDAEIVINKPIIMEVVIDHPQAGNDYVASKWVYKSMRDFISGSNLGFSVPAFGGTSEKSGVTGSIIVLPFNYTKPLDLPVGMNTRIRLRIEDEIAPEGKFGTVTFYMDKIKL